MPTIPNLKDLGKRQKAKILEENPGFLSRIAERTGKTLATVSRVFSGDIRRSPEIEAEINKELARIDDQKEPEHV